MRQKYPRTLHHPSSPGVQSDDKVARDMSAFDDREVVITEKMDGENTTLYGDGYHARSLETSYHPSRAWVASLHGQIAYRIPDGHRVCGENLYARHSVVYDDLVSYFLVFSVWTAGNTCLSWDETEKFCAELGLSTVPVLYRGAYSPPTYSSVVKQLDPEKQEGCVMRLAEAFSFAAFDRSVVKWVRSGHVQSDVHWSKAHIVPNGLQAKKGEEMQA